MQQLAQAQEMGRQGQHDKAVGVLEAGVRCVDEFNVPVIRGAATSAGMEQHQQHQQQPPHHVTLRLGPNHWLRTQLLAAHMKACIDLGTSEAWPKALASARQLVQPYRFVYPRCGGHDCLQSLYKVIVVQAMAWAAAVARSLPTF
jgi:hypothetical protein